MKKKKILYIIIGILFIIISILIFYKENEVYIAYNEVENYIDTFAFYLQDEADSENYSNSKNFPSIDSGYEFNKAVCDDENTKVNFNYSDWGIHLSNFNKNITKCKLYFDLASDSARKYILSQNKSNGEKTSISSLATNDEGLFTAPDDTGTSYYYRGASKNNYFYFGGYYWRIIRINGDGSLRLIYQGTSADSTGTDASIGSNVFNSNINDNAYHGYMYGLTGQSEYDSTHTNTNDSTIKGVLDKWYLSNIKSYEKYIDFNQGFCNDRGVASEAIGTYGITGYGTNQTAYASSDRVFSTGTWNWLTDLKPILTCNQQNDLFTTKNSSIGNKALTNPIGLITLDESIFAGAYQTTANSNYYLYTGVYQQTMTAYFYSGGAHNWGILATGGLDFNGQAMSTASALRPVINIKKSVKLVGTGTSSNPYVIDDTSDKERAKNYILANKTIKERTSITGVLTSNTTGTIYTAPDKDGTSYYYAGAPTNNYFYFGGYYWRIIRINGDGSIRLIYQGTSADSTGSNAGIGTSAFNLTANDNAYVGYMYGTPGSDNYDATHKNTNDSTIKTYLDAWYSNNLASYSDYLDFNQGFCNDRIVSLGERSGYTSNGFGSNAATYATSDRVFSSNSWSWLTEQKPNYICSQENDWFTTSSSNSGNKALTYPIGLITVDEMLYAGGFGATDNTSYYLYTGDYYWTMSPYYYYGNLAYPFGINTNGGLDFNGTNVTATKTVRPVINIKADVTLIGNGTISNPYKIAGAGNSKTAKSAILSNKTISTRTDFSTTLTADTTGTIYNAEDENGISYYFAGAPTDNWVKFGQWSIDTPDIYYGYYSETSNLAKSYSSLTECQNAENYNYGCELISRAGKEMYWRIIRVNGNSSIRMIYQGISTNSVKAETLAGLSSYNPSQSNNMYVGYMYTENQVHGNDISSSINVFLNNWYEKNLSNETEYLDINSGFCNDRTAYICSDNKCSDATLDGGTGTTSTYYGAYLRLIPGWDSSNAKPTFKCNNSSDLFTIKSSSKGNKKLNNPIGLITADEAWYAGGSNANNTSYYLSSGHNYWTMTPWYGGNYSRVFLIGQNGYIDAGPTSDVFRELGVRPVINLKPDVKFTGTGTSSDPYIVS